MARGDRRRKATSPEPKVRNCRPELGHASLTRRNVDSSREAGNRIGETALAGWGREDSNSQMSLPKLAFEVWPEFPFISQRLAIRDFSRLSCQRVTCTPVQSISAMNMARRSPLRRGQAMLERRLLWIREFESSHPSQPVRSLLCDFRLCENCRHSRGLGWRAQSLAGKFWNFGSGLVALRRQSPLAIFQFPFRHTRDRFDM